MKITLTDRKILLFVHAQKSVNSITQAVRFDGERTDPIERRRFGVVETLLATGLLRRDEGGRITITPAGLAAIGKDEKETS